VDSGESRVVRQDAHAPGATETMDQATHVSVAGGSEADIVVVGSARVCDAVWPALVQCCTSAIWQYLTNTDPFH
jgi:hypothetical protein